MANKQLVEQWKRDSLTLALVVAVLRKDIEDMESSTNPKCLSEVDEETIYQLKRVLSYLTDSEALADYAHIVLVEDVD